MRRPLIGLLGLARLGGLASASFLGDLPGPDRPAVVSSAGYGLGSAVAPSGPAAGPATARKAGGEQQEYLDLTF